MIIPFSEDTRILGETGCWQLEESKSVDGKTKWMPSKFFSDIRLAVSEAIRREIKLHPNSGLADSTTAIDGVTARNPDIIDHVLAEVKPEGTS